MDALTHFSPAAQACLRRHMQSTEAAQNASAPTLLPPARLCQGTLAFLLTRCGKAPDGRGISTGDLLLALVTEMPALQRHLVEAAVESQWWRQQRRARPAQPSQPRPTPIAVVSTPSHARTAASVTTTVAATPLPAGHTMTASSAELATQPVPPWDQGTAPAGELSPQEQRTAVVRAVQQYVQALVQHVSRAQLQFHGLGFTRLAPPDDSQSQSDSRDDTDWNVPAEDQGKTQEGMETAPAFQTARSLLPDSPASPPLDTSRHVHSAVASTGCASLDALLALPSSSSSSVLVATSFAHTSASPSLSPRGGFRYGWVTEISGEAGAGKTQLVLQCLLHQIAVDLADGVVRPTTSAASVGRSTRACLYIVSEDVPASRLGALARGAAQRVLNRCTELPSAHGADTQLRACLTPAALLARLQVKLIRDLGELDALLADDGVLERVASAHGPCGCLLALDSIAATVAGSETGSAAGQTGPLSAPFTRWRDGPSVAHVGLALKAFAVRHQACVLVTNQVRGVPVSAHIAAAPLKRRREADVALQDLLPRRVTSTTSAATGGAVAAATTTPGTLRTRHSEVLPALGAAWSTSAWHVQIMLRKLASAPVSHVLAAESVAPPSLRECVVRGGPNLPPGRCGYRIAEGGIEDDAPR